MQRSTRGFGGRRSLLRVGGAVAFVLALLLGDRALGGTFVTPEVEAVTPTTKTITRTATLSTTGQNMWGSGAKDPTDLTLTLFNESFSESAGFDGVAEACLDLVVDEVCAYFGAGFNVSVSGEIGMSIKLKGMQGGTLDVTYPVTVTFVAPADNSFKPGDTVEITTSLVVDSAHAKVVATFPSPSDIAWNGVFAFNASASGEFCVFGCVDGEIFDFGFDEEGEILSYSQDDLDGCISFLVGFPLGLSSYPNERCNNKGYIFAPDPEVDSTLNSDGTVTAVGEDTYVILPVSAVTWAGRLAGLPPYIQLNLGEVSLGGVTLGWTTINMILTTLETMHQEFVLSPRVDVNLDWGPSLAYKVLDGSTGTELSSSTGTNATVKVGDTIRLTTPSTNSKVITVTPTVLMGAATMKNTTKSVTTGAFTFKTLSFTIGTPPWEICIDFEIEEYCGTIWDGETESWGPVYEKTVSLNEETEDTYFEDTFTITGFEDVEVASFTLVPKPIVEVRKDVVPANAPGRFNLLVDSVNKASNVGDEGTTGRLVLEPGTRVISETEGTGGDFRLFDITITCREYDGGAVHTSGSGTSLNLVLTGGEDLICTVKNRLPVADECDAMTFDNVILGTPGSNKVDKLKGTPQRDIIVGYGGDDVLEGLGGDDCLSGGAGNDRLLLGDGNDVGDGGSGNDIIDAGAGRDIVHGGAGNDTITGGAGDDLIYGEDGDDLVDAGDGNDEVWGGSGNDTLTGANGNDILHGEGGTDAAHGSAGFDICTAEKRTNCEA